jgi:UDP-glucuronate 4-epimerase
MDYTATMYEVVNLGNNRTVSLMEMVRQLEEALGVKARLKFMPEQPGDVPQTWADLQKAGKILQYMPQTTFQDGLNQFVRWLKS